MRRVWLWILVGLLGAGGFVATWLFMHSPYWSLYQIGKAIHQRDARLFLAYVDLDAIIKGQKEALLDEFLPKTDGETRSLVNRFLGGLMPQVLELAKDRVIRVVADPDRDNLPSSWALVPLARVTRNGDYALVVLSDPQSQRRLRLGMRRHPEQGHWQVVEIDPRDLRRLLDEYLKGKFPPKPASPPEAKQGG